MDDVIVFIGDVIMCFTSDWQINLWKQVTKWPNIFEDQGQFSDPNFISGTHQRGTVHFADKIYYDFHMSCRADKSPQLITFTENKYFFVWHNKNQK